MRLSVIFSRAPLSGIVMQQHKDMERVSELQGALQLGNYRYNDAKTYLQSHREVLRTIFDSDTHRQKYWLKDFYTCDISRYWKNDKSAVLLLSGSNEAGVQAKELWLSPMAIDLMQDLLQKKRFLAFDLCNKRSTCKTTMKPVIYQILAQNPRVVRCMEDWDFLKRNIMRQKSGRTKELRAALSLLIGRQKEPVLVILNRPELSTKDDASEYIRTMPAVAKETRGVLKVLVVIRNGVWDIDKNRAGIVRSKLLRTLCLDQRRV